MAKNSNQIHVAKHGENWGVRKSNSARVSALASTQAKAEKKAIEIAKNQKAEVVIHGRDGKIREKNSYGNDPHPPKG